MAFPQQSDPQIIHLFVDNFRTLFSATTNDVESFYNFCDDNCINFLTFQNAVNLLPDNSQLINDFMVTGTTNHGICDFSIEIDLFDPELSGLSEFNLIQNYNQTNQPFTWITVKNPFWLFGKSKITYLDCATINLDKITVTLSNGVTTIDPILNTVNNFIQIYGETRQIKQIVNPTTIIVDRPFSTTYPSATLIAVDVADDRILDYDTFIYRVKKLKEKTYLENIKLEAYVARRIDPTDLSGLSTYFDRILIENSNNISNYCLYNENITQNVRQTLLYLTNNKIGTITTNTGSNIISGYGTDFENDLVVGGKIVVSGQVLTIQSINNTVGLPQQATIIEQATLSVNTTYSPYFELLPIFVLTLSRQQWLTTPSNSKSYADVYRFFTISGYTVGVNTQTGNSPICYNEETNANIINSTDLKGLSIERSSVAISIDNNVKTSGPLCSICEYDYVFPIIVTGTTTTCNSAANGSITVILNPTNITPPFTYSFSGQSGIITIVSNNNFVTCNNLHGGLWRVDVIDSNSDPNVAQTNYFLIEETFNPSIITSGNTITFNVSGGTPTYYISSVPSGSFFQSGLTDGSYTYTANSGTYSFIVGDSLSCVTETITVSVISADTIAINVEYDNPTCDTANDGTIKINVNSPGVLPYTYTFSKSGGDTIITSAFTLTNLTSGLWTVFATDATSEVSNSINVNLVSTFDASSISSINSVTINVSGGTPPYTILGNTIPQFSAQTNGGSTTYTLPSGNVIFSVTDSNGCTKILPASIPINNLALDINILSYANPNSDECANGEVVVSAIGGIPPYLIYSAVNSTNSIVYTNTTGIFTGLTSGFWEFTVTDSALVNNTANVGLTLFTTYDVSYYVSGQTICVNASGGCTGYYSVFINGDGYLYDTGSTTNCFAALCGNNYIEVIDGNIADPFAISIVSGGTFTANTYVVCPLGLTYTVTPITCEKLSDGSITLTATGGTPPYLYYLVNPTNIGGSVATNYTGIFNNLDDNFPLLWTGYTIDISGNTTFVEFSVAKNFYKNIEQYGTGYCITVSGGTAPYTILTRKNNNSPQRPQNQNNIPPGQIITTFTASTAGTYCFSATCGFIYSVVVMDANKCDEDETPINFQLYCPLNLFVSNVTNVSCSADTDGSITVFASGGQEPYISYTATNGTTTYVLGGGGLATFSNLSGGTWTVYVEDSVNQISSVEVDVNSLGIDLTTNINYSSKTWCIVATSFRESQYYLTIDGNTGNTQTILDGIPYCFPISGCSGTTIDALVCRIPFAYQRLYDFSFNEGIAPYGRLIRNSTDGIFYGLTSSGGDFGFGTIFRYNPFSDTLQVLHHFSGTTYNDGASPEGSLIRHPNGKFYGVTTSGGNGYGTIFSCDTTGNYGIIYRFNGTDGDQPVGTLARGTSLYGMTRQGGFDNSGVIFSCSLSGILTVLHEFDQTSNPNDGYLPLGSLLLYGGDLYGTTAIGGRGFAGVLFKCTLAGNYTVLDEFNYGGNDLQNPYDGVIQTGGKFYGTTYSTLSSYGGIYSADTNGNIGKIYEFDGVTGANPIGGLELGADGLLYGMTTQGGDFNYGTIYQIDRGGLNIQKMHDFGNFIVNDGTSPQGRLFQASNRVIYGMTLGGGDGSSGTIFRIDPFDSICCSEETITIGDGIDFNITENYIGGVRNICVDIDVTNSFPPPYYVSINGYQNPYDSNNLTNCYPVNQCSEINVEACHLYFSNTTNVLQFPNNPTGNTPYSLIYLNDKFYGTTRKSIFSCDTQGNNFEFLYYDPSFEAFDYGISASNDGTFLYGNKSYQGASKLFEFDLTNRTLNTLSITNVLDPDSFKVTKPIITSNGKLYGFSKGSTIPFLPSYGSIYHYDFSSSTYTIDYIFSATGLSSIFSYPLEASNGLLYGLAENDSTIGKGGIFSFDINTNAFNVVHQFQLTGGTNPTGGLVEINGLLYGVCTKGGTYSGGTIFSYNISTNEVIHLHNFGPLNVGNGTLLNVNGILYGTASDGDITNAGIIFSYNTFNNEYKRLFSFPLSPNPYGVNPSPIQQLIRINNDLYGINENGGPTDNGGTIYKLGFESCCKSQTYPAITGFTGFTVTTNIIDAVTTEFCVNINEEIFFQPPYTIDFNGTVYTVTGTTGHCYTITGCGVFDIIVCSGVEGIQASGCCYEQTVGVACTDISLITSSINIPCGDDSGIISAFATGGTTLYTFELTNGINTYTSSGIHNQIVTFTGLTAGLWNLTVTDTASNTATQQYNLSNFIVNYSYQGNQACVSISSTTYTSSTFFVLVNGVSYGYDNSLSANCYTVTGCSNNQLFIYELITNNLPYTVIEYFTGTPITNSSYSTLIEPLDNVFYGTSGAYLFSANTQGNIAPIIDFPGDQPRQYLYLNNGIIYGATTNGGINGTGIIFTCDTSGNYGTFFEPQFINLLGRVTNPPIFRHSNGLFYGTAISGVDGLIYSCDTQNNGNIIFNQPLINSGIASILEASNGLIYGIVNTSNFVNSGQIFSADTLGNVGLLYTATWPPTPPEPSFTFTKLNEFLPGLIYSTSSYGGQFNGGTIFTFDLSGNINILHEFSGGNNDGFRPKSELFQGSNGLLYGTTEQGGQYGYGVVYSIDVYGNNFSILHHFEDSTTGYYPSQAVVEAANGNLYGITFFTAPGTDSTLLYELQAPYSGCSYFSTFDTICDLSLNTVTTNIPCFDNNGLISAIAFGGVPNYFYTLTNGLATFTQTGTTNQTITFTGLTAGTYTLTVVDSSTFTASTATTVYDLSNFDVTLSTSGNQVCIVVTSTTVPSQTYTVQLQGNSYSYTASTTGTCYTVTGCGLTNVVICNDVDNTFFKNLVTFDISIEGSNPTSNIISVNGIFYGITTSGPFLSPNQFGTIYTSDTLGNTGVIHIFSDGENALTNLMLASNQKIYGVSNTNTSNSNGTIFTIDLFGNYNIIYNFSGTTYGYFPVGELEESFDGYLYGTTVYGGYSDLGILYKIDLSGNNFTIIHHFSGYTIEDGAMIIPTWGNQFGNLTRSGLSNVLYGTTPIGGVSNIDYPNGCGTIFSCDTSGNYGIVYKFSGGTDGAYPNGKLTYINGIFYGVAKEKGLNDEGVIFTCDTLGNYGTIHSFNDGVSGGINPTGNLININGTLFGQTEDGGNYYGIIFSCDTTGNNFGIVYSFTGGFDGAYPIGTTQGNDGDLYGVTDDGTIFKLNINPEEPCCFYGSVDVSCTLYLNTVGTNIPCFDDSGVISVLGFGGYPNYEYTLSGLINGTATGTTNEVINFTGLTPGFYSVTVTDISGNSVTQNYDLTNFDVIVNFDINTAQTGNEICIILTSTTLTANTYYVEIQGNVYTYDTSSLTGNCYTVTGCGTTLVTISGGTSGCTYNTSVDIPCNLVLYTYYTNIPCETDSGVIQVVGYGGIPTYTFTLVGPTTTTTVTGTTGQIIDFTGLTSGQYNVSVIDTIGFTQASAVTVFNLSYFDASVVAIDNQICVTISGESLTANTYVVNIDGFLYNYDTSSLTGNCYTVTGCGTTLVTISGGTSGCTYNASVDVSCTLLVDVISSSIPCEDNSGIISLLGFGGTPVYTYTITNGFDLYSQTGTTNQTVLFSGLTSGVYSINVTDSGGLTASTAATVINLSYFDVSVATNDDQICVTISADSITANTYVVNIDGFLYNYDTSSLTGNCYTVTGCGLTSVIISGGTSGCTYQTGVNVSCDLLLNVTNTSIPCENNSGIISVLAFGGTPDYSYLITNGVSNFTQIGTTNQTVTFTGLTSGSYSVSVTDSGGLTASTATTVLNLSYFDVDVTTNDDKICIVISADVITATTYVVTIGNDVYTYDTSSLTGNCYTVTGCGLTTVTISGGTSGCTYQTGVEVSCDLLLNVSSTNIPCEDNSGTVSVLAFAGTPNYTYTITNGLIFATQTGTTNQTVTFSGLSAGLYNINVVDSGGLTASTATTVINLSIFDANVSLNGNQLSVSISSNTITAETYTVNVGGTLYPYNINTNPNLFTVSGCGTTDVTITSFIQGPINYGNTLLEFNDNNFQVIQNFGTIDGGQQFDSVVEVNKILYGVKSGSIISGVHGLIYSCDLSGNNLTILYKFSGVTFSDGSNPRSTLLYTTDGYLVGTTAYGGVSNDINYPYGHGTIFKYDLSTNTLSYIHKFNGYILSDGHSPYFNLFELNNIIYGVTQEGGISGQTGGFGNVGNGTIYTCTTSGNYGIITSLTGSTQPLDIVYNSDDGFIYSVSYYGPLPSNTIGTLFKINLNGDYTFIRAFSGSTYGDGAYGTSLIKGSNNIFYGTTQLGGVNNDGTIFSCDTLGNYGVIHSFLSATDGRWPQATLREYYNTGVFFGTCTFGGANNFGTIFTCNTAGDFGVIHQFTGLFGLSNPRAQLYIASNGSLYGTTDLNDGIYTWVINPPTGTTISSCTYTTTIDIPCSLTLGVVSSSIPCDDDSGIISLIASAGTPYYTYTIVGPGSTTFTQTGDTGQVVSFSGLVAGIYNINVIDNGGLTASTAATIYNLSFFDVDVNVNGNQICLTISSSTLSADTYFVQIQGTTYTYDTTLSANCFTVTGCGPTDITVVTGAPGIASEYEYSILHHFSGTTYGDGMNPFTNSIIYYDNQLYGTTRFGGFGDGGTIFRLNEDGSNYQVVASFTAATGLPNQPANIRVGQEPVSRLIVGPGNAIYGSTAKGGYFTNSGTLFSCDTTTGVISVPNGGNGFGAGNQGLTLHSNGKFYRASSLPGSYGSLGMLQFGGLPINIINLDGTNGSFPYDGLTEYPPTGMLYGLTHDSSGLVVPIGNYGGVMFSINPAGTVYSVLYEFSGTTYGDGANPFCRLFLASNNLFYGTTEYGGTYDAGTIFTCNTSGNCGIIHNFAGFAYEEGENPMGTLTQDPTGKLYGITQNGGIFNFGTVFTINQDGSNYEILHHFSGRTDGATDGSQPKGEINYINGSLYGMTFQGGNQGEFFGNGVIYKLSVFNPPVTGCSFNTTVNIPCGGPLDIFTTIVNIPCDDNSGVITTTVTGGSPNYQYSLTNGATTYSQTGGVGDVITFGGLSSGVWTLTVTDSIGNTLTESYVISTYNVTFTTGLTNNELCISISGASPTGDTFYITIQGNTYVYDAFAPFNCFELTGCGTNTVVVSQGIAPLSSYLWQVGVSPSGSQVSSVPAMYALRFNGYEPITYNPLIATGNTIYYGSDNGSIILSTPPPTYAYYNYLANTDLIFTLNLDFTINTWGVGSYFNVEIGGINVYSHSANTGTYSKTLTIPFNQPSSIYNATVLISLNNTTFNITDGYWSAYENPANTGCTFEGLFEIPCPPLEIFILNFSAFCYNGLSQVIVGATGGTQPYTIILNEIFPTVTAYTATTIFNSPTIFPYNWAEFYVPAGGTYYGTVIDANGDIIGSQVITTTNTYNVDINFTSTNVVVTINGNAPFGYSTINLNGTLYGNFPDGTYTYPISCGTNTVIVDGYVYLEVFYAIACTYSGSTVIPCDLTCDVDFVQPQCSGSSVSEITVFISGGTSPYDITIERPITNVIYSATTSTSPFVMTGLNLTQGGWTVVVTDANGDTCINEIFVDTTFDAIISSISTTGFCITISGGTPLYSIEIDKTNMGGNIYNDGTYCFTASCGTHEVVVSNPFASPPCPIELNFEIPCPELDCQITFTDPTCGKEDGGVIITVNGGVPPYFYQITDGTITYDSGSFLPTNTYTFNNLGVGTWVVTVGDSSIPRQKCDTTIVLQNSFQVIVSAYTATSLTYGLICFDITGGLPPYTILIDNILVGSGLTPSSSLCYTATCGVNHSYLVFDSGNPCIEYVNQPIFSNSSFDTTSDWLQPYVGVSNCTNPTVNPVGFLSRYAFIDTTKGAFVYTALTSALVSLGGCFQNIPLSQNFIFPYTAPLSVTYSWQIGTGLVSGISPGYLSFGINTPFGSSVPVTAPPFPGLQSYRSYSGIHTQTTTTVPLSGIYSGYSINLVESGGYSANTAGNGSIFEITGAQLTILSYTLPCPCAATGTTFVPCFTSLPIITVVTYQNPPCLVNPDGIIVVSGSSGVPPYTYSATNGTISYSNTTGIFTGLTEDIWYLSLIDSLGQVSTTTEVVTLNYTFFANVDVSLTGFCITISGGTLPYNIIFDGNSLPWNYSNITNCYTADCQTTAVIIVQDSSG